MKLALCCSIGEINENRTAQWT